MFVYYAGSVFIYIMLVSFVAAFIFFNKYYLEILLAVSPFIGIFVIYLGGGKLKVFDLALIIIIVLSFPWLLKNYFQHYFFILFPFFLLSLLILMNVVYIQFDSSNLEVANQIQKIDFSFKTVQLNNLKNFFWLQTRIAFLIFMMSTINTTEKFEKYMRFYLLIQIFIGVWSLGGVIYYYMFPENYIPPVTLWRYGNFFRLRGVDHEPSFYGTYLLMILPLFFFPFLNKKYLYNRTFHLVSLAVIVLNLILSLSSATWMLLPITLLITFIYIFKYIREKSISIPLIILLISVGFLITVLFSFIANSYTFFENIFLKIVNPGESSSGQTRIENMLLGLRIFYENPVFGSGYYEGGNLFIEFLALYGFLGGALLLFLLAYLFKQALIYHNLLNNYALKTYSIALQCSMAIMITTMLINTNFYKNYYWVIFGFILARFNIVKKDYFYLKERQSANSYRHNIYKAGT